MERKVFNRQYDMDREMFNHIAKCEVDGINSVGTSIICHNYESRVKTTDVMDFFILTGEEYDVAIHGNNVILKGSEEQ